MKIIYLTWQNRKIESTTRLWICFHKQQCGRMASACECRVMDLGRHNSLEGEVA